MRNLLRSRCFREATSAARTLGLANRRRQLSSVIAQHFKRLPLRFSPIQSMDTVRSLKCGTLTSGPRRPGFPTDSVALCYRRMTASWPVSLRIGSPSLPGSHASKRRFLSSGAWRTSPVSVGTGQSTPRDWCAETCPQCRRSPNGSHDGVPVRPRPARTSAHGRRRRPSGSDTGRP